MGVTQPRVSWAALWDYASRRGITTVAELATRCGVDRSVLQRYKAAGTLTDTAADRIAVRLGEVPDAIWAEEWAEATAELVRRADAEEEKRRARAAQQKRRYRQTTPDYAERQRAKVEAWKAANPGRVRRYHADYQRAWRERQGEEYRAARRDYQRAYRARHPGHPGQDQDSRLTTTSTSPIHAQSTSNPHAQGAGRVASFTDNGTTEQEVA